MSDYGSRFGKGELGLGACGLLGRSLFLCFTRNVQTGVVWFTKILTDPFNDVKQYWRAPLFLMKGELVEPAHGRPA